MSWESDYVVGVGRALDRIRDSDQWRSDRHYVEAFDRVTSGSTGVHEHRRPGPPKGPAWEGWPEDRDTPLQIEWDLTAKVAEGRMTQVEPGVFRAEPGQLCLFCLEVSRRGMGPNSGPG